MDDFQELRKILGYAQAATCTRDDPAFGVEEFRRDNAHQALKDYRRYLPGLLDTIERLTGEVAWWEETDRIHAGSRNAAEERATFEAQHRAGEREAYARIIDPNIDVCGPTKRNLALAKADAILAMKG